VCFQGVFGILVATVTDGRADMRVGNADALKLLIELAATAHLEVCVHAAGALRVRSGSLPFGHWLSTS
jgi:hypothetical protein